MNAGDYLYWMRTGYIGECLRWRYETLGTAPA